MLCTKFIMYFSLGNRSPISVVWEGIEPLPRLGHYSYPDNTIGERFPCEKSIIGYYYIRLYFTVFLLARSNTRDIPFSNILISKKQFLYNNYRLIHGLFHIALVISTRADGKGNMKKAMH